MTMEGTAKYIRYLMVFFNALFIIFGIGVLGMGIYAREKKDEFDSYAIVVDASTSQWGSFSSLCIAVGVLVILLGGSGCIGACKENKCLLGFFAGFVALIVLLQFVAAGLGYRYRDKLDNDLYQKLNKTLEKANEEDPNGKYRKAWNNVQKDLKCCGVNDPHDWDDKPDSCKPGYKGCYSKIKDGVNKWKVWAGAALGIAFVEILAIVFAVLLIRKIRSDNYTIV